jgi:hypothetical protein
MLTAETSGTTRTLILSTCWRLGRFTLYLALFSAQDSLSASRNFSAPCGENKRHGMLWNGPRHGFRVYVACTTLYPSWTSDAQVVQTGLWSRAAVATELGGILRAMGRHPPHGHGAFSELVFGQRSMRAEVVNEGDCEEGVSYEEGGRSQSHTSHEPAADCGYLEDDDIEDW